MYVIQKDAKCRNVVIIIAIMTLVMDQGAVRVAVAVVILDRALVHRDAIGQKYTKNTNNLTN
jgi:hypothetical protein